MTITIVVVVVVVVIIIKVSKQEERPPKRSNQQNPQVANLKLKHWLHRYICYCRHTSRQSNVYCKYSCAPSQNHHSQIGRVFWVGISEVSACCHCVTMSGRPVCEMTSEQHWKANLAVPVEEVERTMVHFGDPPFALTSSINAGCMQWQTMLGHHALCIHLANLTATKHYAVVGYRPRLFCFGSQKNVCVWYSLLGYCWFLPFLFCVSTCALLLPNGQYNVKGVH